MTYRITKTTLQNQLDRLNAKLNEADQMELYWSKGGNNKYCLRMSDQTKPYYALTVTPFMTGREMNQYLYGALDFITPDK